MEETSRQPVELSIIRTFRASREKVFGYFTTIDGFRQWLGPRPCRITEGDVSFTVGGAYSMKMETPQGAVWIKGVFQEIEEDKRIAFTFQWDGNEALNSVLMQISIDFSDEPEGTLIHFRQSGFESIESRDNHHDGWNGSFDRLLSCTQMASAGSMAWTELFTRDLPQTVSFYGSLFGWETMEMPVGDKQYTMFTHAGEPFGGIQVITDACPESSTPRWLPYINIADLDAAVKRTRDNGGSVSVPPTEVSGMGRFAVLVDPQGAEFAVWQSLSSTS